MNDGLITRIGKWIDSHFEEKVTFAQLQEYVSECQKRHIDAMGAITEMKTNYVVSPKDVAELKERLGHLEVYVGMKRVVDPSKPAVAKSAFSM